MSTSNQFLTLFDLLPIGAYRSSASGYQLRINKALVKMNGYLNEAAMLEAVNASKPEWYVDPARGAEFRDRLKLDGYVTGFVSESYRHKTRERIWISENAHIVRDADGKILYYEGTVEDISQQRATQDALHTSERRYRALNDNALYATIIADADGIITFANAGIEPLLGVTPAEIVGTNLFATMHPDNLLEHRAEFRNVQIGENTGRESIARHRHADGTWRYLGSLSNDCRDDPAIGGIVVNWRDETEAEHTKRRLRELAENDSLTGLTNRAYFEELGAQILRRAGGTNNTQLALFFIDLNRFKLVNDSHGHSMGDGVLKEVAIRIRSALRDGDLVARLGGDEFAILTVVDTRLAASQLAARMLKVISQPIIIGSLRFDVGASIGISIFPSDADTFDELLGYADLAMFEAKAQRASASRAFKPALLRRALAQVAVVTDLHQATLEHELQVYFQPVVTLINGHWTGFEALVRWHHPIRGIIMPDSFVKAAEEQGLVGKLGAIVAEKTLQQARKWREEFGFEFHFAINVSAYQLRDDTFAGFLQEAFERHRLSPHRFTLEITESAFIETSQDGGDALSKLRALGVRIALDDLGIGYSSFDYLKRFPIDMVKLDQGFISGLPGNKVDVAIVRSLVTLARSLGMILIAEGIEKPEQAAYLLELGCNLGQGFLYSHALPAHEATEKMRAMGVGDARAQT